MKQMICMQGPPTLRQQQRQALHRRAQGLKQLQLQHGRPMMAAALGCDSLDDLHAGAANPAPAAAPSAAPEGARTEAAAAPAPAQAPAGAKTEAAGGFVTTKGTNFVLNGEILQLSGSNDYFLIFRWAPAYCGGHLGCPMLTPPLPRCQ